MLVDVATREAGGEVAFVVMVQSRCVGDKLKQLQWVERAENKWVSQEKVLQRA